MDIKQFLNPEAITGTLVIIGGTALLFQRLGLVTFGKKKCNQIAAYCPDPTCKQNIINNSSGISKNTERIIELKKQIDAFDNKMDVIREDVAWVKGYLKSNGLKK